MCVISGPQERPAQPVMPQYVLMRPEAFSIAGVFARAALFWAIAAFAPVKKVCISRLTARGALAPRSSSAASWVMRKETSDKEPLERRPAARGTASLQKAVPAPGAGVPHDAAVVATPTRIAVHTQRAFTWPMIRVAVEIGHRG
jgi:hypothetical protein